MKGIRILFLLAVMTYVYQLQSQSNFVLPASDELKEELNVLDSILFEAGFETCDTVLMKSLLAPDLEFYHDKWGLMSTSAEQFMQGVRSNCDDWQNGRNPRARRTIVKSSIEVYPISNYGALQKGDHLFYQYRDGEYQFTESAQFIHLWNKNNGRWQLSRVYSIDHRPTPR